MLIIFVEAASVRLFCLVIAYFVNASRPNAFIVVLYVPERAVRYRHFTGHVYF